MKEPWIFRWIKSNQIWMPSGMIRGGWRFWLRVRTTHAGLWGGRGDLALEFSFPFFIEQTLRLFSREILGRVILRELFHAILSKSLPLERRSTDSRYSCEMACQRAMQRGCIFCVPFTFYSRARRTSKRAIIPGIIVRNRQGTLSLSLARSKVVRSKISRKEIWILILYRWKGFRGFRDYNIS